MRTFELVVGGLPRKGALQPIRSPFSNKVVGEVAFAGEADLQEAVEAACRAAPEMAALPRHARIKILHGVAHGLARRQEEIARIICDEAGKPLAYAEGEAARAVQTFVAAAEACKEMGGEYLSIDAVQAGAGRHGILRRFPLGPVAGISPFNFPLNLSAHKIAPAIAAGCPVVLKPASQTPMSALVLAELAREAGLLAGGLSVIPASRQAADTMVTDARFKLLTFTGSAEVGWEMKRRAGTKRVVLELGGNAAVLVGPDADWELVIPRLVTGAFAYAGQICISVQRIFVLGRFEELCDRFVRATRALAKTGDPLDRQVMVGPMIDRPNQERILQWIDQARAAGARVLCGGRAEGPCVAPTVLTGVDARLPIYCEEAFAPVVVVEPVADWEEAIARTNESRFGLQCGVFTNDLKALWRCYEAIDVGGVMHNDSPLFRVDHMPYGGAKDSGTGREGPRYAIEEMSELKLLVINPGF